MQYTIKEATFDNLPDIARIHVLSWQQTYVGLVPQTYLDGLNIADRQKKWEEIFQGNTAEDTNLYIAYDNNKAAGFISFGRGRNNQKAGWGEIYAIYLLKEYWGKAIGYSLFKSARQQFRNEGITRAYTWVMDTNQNAIRSYIKWGGIVDVASAMDDSIGGQAIKEIMVTFRLD